jgi:hypothetical protein
VSTVEQRGTGVNLLVNSSFATNIDGWELAEGNSGLAWNFVRNDGDLGDNNRYLPPGTAGAVLTAPGTMAAGSYQVFVQSKRIPISALNKYIASAYFNGFRCQTQIYLRWYNAAGGSISVSDAPISAAPSIYAAATTPPLISAFPRVATAASQPPAGAAYAELSFAAIGTGEANPYVLVFEPMLEQATATQTQPSPYNMGGAESFAMWSLELTADGRVAGIYAMVDGVRRDLVFDFDSVTFVSSDGNSSIEGGVIRQSFGGYMIVSGPGIGASADMLEWYGPSMPVANITKANAITYKDLTGKSYQPVPPATEPIEFNASSNTTTSPQTLQLVNNNTAGANKVVTARYYFQSRVTNKVASGSGSATLSLWRKVGAGAFVQLGSSINVNFTDNAMTMGGGWYDHDLSGSGELIVTDTDTSLSTHTYEWRLTSRTSTWPATAQSLTIKTVE